MDAAGFGSGEGVGGEAEGVDLAFLVLGVVLGVGGLVLVLFLEFGGSGSSVAFAEAAAGGSAGGLAVAWDGGGWGGWGGWCGVGGHGVLRGGFGGG